MEKIERIQLPTTEEFFAKYYFANKPVIITGVMNDWQAVKNWSNPEYLKSTVGNMKVPVAISKQKRTLIEQMDFNNFIDIITVNKDLEARYYLQQLPILSTFPGLAKDFTVPNFIMDKKLDINLWIGSGGNVTPTHYDGESNFLSQIKGEKRIILYPPNEVSNMYPFPVFSRNSHISQVDFLDPNLEKYPKYKNVKSFECTLKSGEMLFIPVLWWHSVETISKELTISLNFWWRAPLRQYMTYLGARTLSNLLFHNSKTLLSIK